MTKKEIARLLSAAFVQTKKGTRYSNLCPAFWFTEQSPRGEMVARGSTRLALASYRVAQDLGVYFTPKLNEAKTRADAVSEIKRQIDAKENACQAPALASQKS